MQETTAAAADAVVFNTGQAAKPNDAYPSLSSRQR